MPPLRLLWRYAKEVGADLVADAGKGAFRLLPGRSSGVVSHADSLLAPVSALLLPLFGSSLLRLRRRVRGDCL